MTRDQALREIACLVATLRECETEAAAARLLERVAGAEPEIRDVLLEVGARAALRGEVLVKGVGGGESLELRRSGPREAARAHFPEIPKREQDPVPARELEALPEGELFITDAELDQIFGPRADVCTGELRGGA